MGRLIPKIIIYIISFFVIYKYINKIKIGKAAFTHDLEIQVKYLSITFTSQTSYKAKSPYNNI